MTKPAAPPKPAFGAPCNGCGACCRAVPCHLARDLLGAFDAPCPALEFDAGRYWCGLIRSPAAHILALRGQEWAGDTISKLLIATGYFGAGCDSTGDDDGGRDDRADRDGLAMMRDQRRRAPALWAPSENGGMNMQNYEQSMDMFLADVAKEFARATAKFPQPNPTIAALTEEVGEAVKAALHIREGKSNTWWPVWDEAVQVAVMAMRLAIEGDPTVGAVPNEENCR